MYFRVIVYLINKGREYLNLIFIGFFRSQFIASHIYLDTLTL